MPTYQVIFDLRGAPFPAGSFQTAYAALGVMLLYIAVTLVLATWAFNRQNAWS